MNSIFTVLFSSDASFIVSACKDFTIKVWNVEKGEEIQTMEV